MEMAERSTRLQEKFTTRMKAKSDQVKEIMTELTYFQNESFKKRVAELLQWCVLQLGNKKELPTTT